MKVLTLSVRILLGLIYTVFGLNAFLNFLPTPPQEPGAAAFVQGLLSAGYFLPFLKIVEIVCGLLLISGRFVSLALVVLMPITLNILLFHVFLAPGGSALSVLMIAANLFLAFRYRDQYVPLLRVR